MIIVRIILNLIVIISTIRLFAKNNCYKKDLLFSLFMLPILLITNVFIEAPIKVLINSFLTIILVNKIYKIKIGKSILVSTIILLLFAIVESISLLIFINVFKYPIESLKGNFLIDISIFLLCMVFVNIKSIKKKALEFKEIANMLDEKSYFVTVSIIIISIISVFYNLYFSPNKMISLLLSTLITFGYLYIVFVVLRDKSNNEKLKLKYTHTIDMLGEYERIIEKNKMQSHENKNHFIALKSMNKKEASKFIEELLGKQKENPSLLEKVIKIKLAGLRGLVYQKLLDAEEKGIETFLEVESSKKEISISDRDYKDLLTIAGVLMDNAIDEKSLLILISTKSEISITISNHFQGEVDFEKMEKKGFSTKGSNRGYGLSLLREVLNSNPNLIFKRRINADVISQTVKIKKEN